MRSLYSLLFVAALLGIPVSPLRHSPQQDSLAFTHVSVIDATGSPAMTDMTVVIAGDRITEIGKTGEVVLPEKARVIDATGKFLIPGLWDMHVHLLCKERVEVFFPLLAANGITGIRDMGSPPEEVENIDHWRKQIAEGTLVGPRIVASGPMVDGPRPMFPGISVAVGSEAEGRRAVNSLRARGADFIKVYSLLPRATYFAIADEANRQGIPFAGHVPNEVSPAEASDAGQKSIEHLSGILLACSTSEDELRKQLVEARAKSDPALVYQALSQINRKGGKTYSNEKAEALFARFVKNDTWQVPTLVVAWAVASVRDSKVKPVPSARGQTIQKRIGPRQYDTTADSLALLQAESLNTFELAAAMHRAGVEFMAGTDAPNPWLLPGPSVHDELSLLVLVGFTPMEALQAATSNPAKYLGLLDSLGTVEVGKIADLVLLEASPLENISNTRRISAVVLRGRLIPKAELKRLETGAQAGINHPSDLSHSR